VTEPVESSLDLEAYLARIDYRGGRDPNSATLEGLHLAHGTHIPFENCAIHLGQPIRLDLESLQAKLVRARRGGYCFEHNTLFAAALEALGFRVSRLAARVRIGATRVLPRTHMLLEVAADGRDWLADVGFGAGGPLSPVPLEPDDEVRQAQGSHRVVESERLLVLQELQRDQWCDLYAFTREPQYPVDFEMANHFTSTHPDSIFVRTLTAQRQALEKRWTLRNHELLVEGGGRTEKRDITDAELGLILSETFGLAFAPAEVDLLIRAGRS
jgi:N-hydroxyarylamine O-acetyltransferase